MLDIGDVEQEFPDTVDWGIAVRIGQQFERELRELQRQGHVTEDGRKGIVSAFKRQYSLAFPEGEALLELDDPTRNFLEAVAGRVINGNAIAADGLMDENPVIPAGLGIPDELAGVVQETLRGLREWRELLSGEGSQTGSRAWHRNRLEYEFAVSAPDLHADREIVLVAPEYDGRLVDWPTFSVHSDPDLRLAPAAGDPDSDSDTDNSQIIDFIPTPL